ncbi:hypothetical protein AN642_02080 [Epulopiscium sp. SCG-B10WGA-EpuloA2]|nr:hypothetical protein AN642_02080 [Epulopiscium sp. SCG-B10WGA-EpuloA2]ONI46108.1 hypothetical protein AN641_02255 [Epulopiscium sp. SCG-C07WGA-EpuloA2]
MDITLILKIAGLGLGLWAVQQILDQAGMKDASKYVGIAGTLVVIMVVVNEIMDFFTTIQTFFTF